jgi:hypothetical protein
MARFPLSYLALSTLLHVVKKPMARLRNLPLISRLSFFTDGGKDLRRTYQRAVGSKENGRLIDGCQSTTASQATNHEKHLLPVALPGNTRVGHGQPVVRRQSC